MSEQDIKMSEQDIKMSEQEIEKVMENLTPEEISKLLLDAVASNIAIQRTDEMQELYNDLAKDILNKPSNKGGKSKKRKSKKSKKCKKRKSKKSRKAKKSRKR